MRDVFICDAVRTPIGRYGGSLSKVRTDDLAAVPIKALLARNPKVDWEKLDEVYFGCANQAGEDNRNVARMALLLAGLPASVPGVTINRLCASGLEAVGTAARAIRAGEMEFAIAGGVESMTRAPFVQGKSAEAFSRAAEIYDTTIGWRFVNPLMKKPIRRRIHAGDGGERGRGFPGHPRRPGCFRAALAAARRQGHGDGLSSPRRSCRSRSPAARRRSKSTRDEHPRETTIEQLAKLKTVVAQSRHHHRRQRLRRQ